MKKILIFLIVCVCLNASILKEVKNRYKDIDYFRLKNGMQVYLLSDKQAKNVSMSMSVKVGTEIENSDNFGISHLVEHIIFRDQRVPHHDYLDYFKEIGATYVNAYTRRYETEFVVDVLKKDSYKILKELPKMFFDKNITKEDLKIEKGALQTEIGRSKWYYPIFWKIKKALDFISPKKPNIYRDDFKLSKQKELPPFYLAQQNNLKFTMNDVLKHYREYYYPANMRLEVVGNFDAQKMKKLIKDGFENINKDGSKTTNLPPRDATLSGRAYKLVSIAIDDKNRGYIGYKYVENSYKKYQIIRSYMDNLATILQQKLRNQKGDVYTVGSDFYFNRGASINVITFDGLHKNFAYNREFIEKFIQDDIKNLNDKKIKDSLKEYLKNYQSIEHDTASLYSLIHHVEYLKDELNESRDPYTIFNSITYDEFRKNIAEICKKDNNYKVFYEDYYFFPYEAVIVRLVLIFLFIGSIMLYLRRKITVSLAKVGVIYSKRDIKLTRRLSNRLFFLLGLFFVIFFSGFVSDWFIYLVSKYIFGNPYYMLTLDLPYSYIATIFGFVIYMVSFIFFYYKVFLARYYARVEASDDGIFLLGAKTIYLPKEEIKEIKVVSWSFDKYNKTVGYSLMFWKSVVKIELKNGQVFYLRAKNAQHLKEDLEKVLSKGE